MPLSPASGSQKPEFELNLVFIVRPRLVKTITPLLKNKINTNVRMFLELYTLKGMLVWITWFREF